jgi:DNA-binding CsgD family transcriptional regulator/tetratricopeptide (TPR) repeat protein
MLPRFVGRTAELAAARAALERGLAGESGVLLIEGDAGIGKTRLVDEVLRDLDVETVCRAEAREPEVRSAFALLTRAIGGDAAAQPFQPDVLDGLLELLEEACTRGAVVVVLDDIHWADPSSVQGLWTLSRHVGHLPVAFALTCRLGPRDSTLVAVIDRLTAAGAERVLLGPLTSEESRSLGEEIGAEAGGARAMALAGGNPLLVQLAASHDAADAPPIDAEGLLLAPFARLPPETAEVISMAAVLGSVSRLHDLAVATDRRAIDLVDPIGQAIDAAILLDDPDGVVFRSPLLRDAVYASAAPESRAAMHRRAGELLAAAGAPAATVAAQLAAGGAPSEDTVRWLQVAADELRSTAPEVVIELLQMAQELLEPGSPAHTKVRAALIAPLARGGRIHDAISVGDEVLAVAGDDAIRADARAGLALANERLGRRDVASSHWLAAAALDGVEPARRASLLALGSHALLLSGDPARAREHAERAEAMGTELGSHEAASIARTTLALCAAAEGDIASAVSGARAATELQGAASLPWLGASTARHYLGLLLIDADELEAAGTVLTEGRQTAADAGSRTYVPFYHWELASRAALAGRLDDAVAEIETGLALAEESGTRLGVARAHALLAWVCRHRGQPAGVAEHLAIAEREELALGHQLGGELVGWVRGLELADAGDLRAALHVLLLAWESGAALRFFRSYRLLGPTLARVAAAVGESEVADEVASVVETGAARSGLPAAVGAARRARGHAAGDPDLLVAAVEAYEQGPRPIDLNEARAEAGAALIAAGRRREGGVLLRAAVSEFEALGASGDAQRVTAMLRGAGMRAARTRQRPESGWDSLTPTEVRVVGLVARGLSNRLVADELYLSRYTVETHLKHAFAKLGVSSRVELTRIVAASGLRSSSGAV